LNLNQSEGDFLPEFRDKAISLKIIDGSERDIGESLVKVVEALDRYLLSSFKSDFSETVDDWKNLSLPVGSPIAVSLSAGRKREGTYLGIDENGNLKFGAGGKTEIISSADVEVF
jgi:biotin-(acetyl-CoA carboxylase) ligase